MTDRYNYLTVALEEDMHADDGKALIAAIMQMRGVLKVEPHVSNADHWIAAEQARFDLGQKILAVVYPKKGA